MKNLKKIQGAIVLLAVAFGILLHPEIIKADEASITFGSESYSTQLNDEFQIGVYIKGDSRVGTYRVELRYDNKRLEYTGGAESAQNGVIVLQGTGLKNEIKYMLNFKTISGGDAYIKVNNAVVNIGERDNEETFEITEMDYADIYIEGRDSVGDEPSIGFDTDIPHIEPAIVINNKPYYMLDLNQQVPEDITWTYSLSNLNFMGQKVAFFSTEDRDVYFAYLFDESETMVCYTYNPSQVMFYPCEVFEANGTTYLYTSPSACETWPEELTLDLIKTQNIVYAVDMEGNGAFCVLDEEGNLVEWDAEEGRKSKASETAKLLFILLVAVIVIALILIGAFITTKKIERKKRLQRKEMRRQAREKEKQDMNELISLDKEDDSITEIPLQQNITAEKKVKKPNPVISVRDVTMRFKIATSNVTGIKEYFIQLLKKEISYRELLALDHVSFDVYKGEVVGIIGTNGSGKSTLLRIVSGALEPTEGEVKVNRKKLQLLTLGTGFDMELTAKENVYLNGAIIGYTEEFINEHYDEIVAFAELEGFMEEKVKNFSSGMVSRLGFAIATVGEASDILILDEVLSVGDEFFRKKSLARIKEMIHGGSTVLMVSHGMDTIREHCTKVVWIEKGKLKMVGEPKEVCGAYQKQFEEKMPPKRNLEMKNGLIKEGNEWYLYKNGEVDRMTSLAENVHGWWYVKDGKIDFSYTGIASNQHGIWYVSKGKIDFNFSGDFASGGKVYKIVKGKVVG